MTSLEIIKDELARIETDYKHCCLGASIPGYGHSRNCYDTGPTNKKMREMAKALSVAVEKLNYIKEFNRSRGYPTGVEWLEILKNNDETLTIIANILTNERESGKAVSGGKDDL